MNAIDKVERVSVKLEWVVSVMDLIEAKHISQCGVSNELAGAYYGMQYIMKAAIEELSDAIADAYKEGRGAA